MLSHFKDMPISDDMKEKVMHVSLPIGNNVPMGCDHTGGWGEDFKDGNNYSLSIQIENKDKGRQFFDALSQGGEIKMPYDKTFWNAYFSMFVDKFGVRWMVNCQLDEERCSLSQHTQRAIMTNSQFRVNGGAMSCKL